MIVQILPVPERISSYVLDKGAQLVIGKIDLIARNDDGTLSLLAFDDLGLPFEPVKTPDFVCIGASTQDLFAKARGIISEKAKGK